MQNNWIPLTKKTMHTSDGHPDTGSPYTNVLMIIINQLTNRIDRLYNIAVGSNEIKEKKGKKICKEK